MSSKAMQHTSASTVTKLDDGQYRTCAVPGPEAAERVVTVKSGRVYLEGSKYDFAVSDFFSVNKVLGAVAQ